MLLDIRLKVNLASMQKAKKGKSKISIMMMMVTTLINRSPLWRKVVRYNRITIKDLVFETNEIQRIKTSSTVRWKKAKKGFYIRPRSLQKLEQTSLLRLMIYIDGDEQFYPLEWC
jgi:hypothetical protein